MLGLALGVLSPGQPSTGGTALGLLLRGRDGTAPRRQLPRGDAGGAVACARFPPPRPTRYREGWLPA
jgi:hypothetical protein